MEQTTIFKSIHKRKDGSVSVLAVRFTGEKVFLEIGEKKESGWSWGRIQLNTDEVANLLVGLDVAVKILPFIKNERQVVFETYHDPSKVKPEYRGNPKKLTVTFLPRTGSVAFRLSVSEKGDFGFTLSRGEVAKLITSLQVNALPKMIRQEISEWDEWEKRKKEKTRETAQ